MTDPRWKHREALGQTFGATKGCIFCREPWPCSSQQVLAEARSSHSDVSADLRAARAMVAFTLDTSRYEDDHPIVRARRELLEWFDARLAAPSAGAGIDVLTMADVLTEAHLRRDRSCSESHRDEAAFVAERYAARLASREEPTE